MVAVLLALASPSRADIITTSGPVKNFSPTNTGYVTVVGTVPVSLGGGVSVSLSSGTDAAHPLYVVWSGTMPVAVIASTVSLNGIGLLATAAAQATSNASLASIDGKLANPMPVSGTFYQATQPVSTVSTFPVSGTFWPQVQAISVSVDSTTQANPTYVASVSTIPVSLAVFKSTIPVSAVQSGEWLVTLSSGSAATPFYVRSASTIPVSVGLFTTTAPVSATQNGSWFVSFASGSAANPFYTLSTATAISGTASALNVVSTNTVIGAGVAEIGNVKNSGTFAVQAAATLAAETTKVIGTVNVAAGQTIAVTNAGTFAVQATQTGIYNVGFTSGSASNPLYVLSTATAISGTASALNVVSTNTVLGAGAAQIGLISGSTVYAFSPVVGGITQSSITVGNSVSVQMFAADSKRKDFLVIALPTNTDFVVGKWDGGASSTDTIILSPGQSFYPNLTISTMSLNWISNTGNQVLRGYTNSWP